MGAGRGSPFLSVSFSFYPPTTNPVPAASFLSPRLGWPGCESCSSLVRSRQAGAQLGTHTGTHTLQWTRTETQVQKDAHRQKRSQSIREYMYTRSSTQAQTYTELHIYRINMVTKSQPRSPLRSSLKQYLIQYRSLSLGLTRARTHTRTPLNRKSVGFQRPGGCGASRARAHRSPRRTERARSPPFLRAGHQRRPTAAWAFAARPRSCREVPSQSPASFQTPKRKKAKSQPFASIQHTFGEWLLASDLQNRFPRGVPGRAETARVTEAGVEHS